MSILLEMLNEAVSQPKKSESLAAKHLIDGLKKACTSGKPVYNWVKDEIPKYNPIDTLDLTADEYKKLIDYLNTTTKEIDKSRKETVFYYDDEKEYVVWMLTISTYKPRGGNTEYFWKISYMPYRK